MDWLFSQASGIITGVVSIGGGIVFLISKALKTVNAVANLKTDVKKLDGRIDKLDGRIDKLDGRIDKLDARIDKLEVRLDQRIDKLEGKVDEILFFLTHKLKKRHQKR
jgi:peptidoglycan hydrolase CwlO-like protein